jgi:hypothetical protein
MEDPLEQGFAPRLSRVAAGLCACLLLGLLAHVFRGWKLIAIPILILLPLFLVPQAVARKFSGNVAKALDVVRLAEWLDDRFERIENRIRRK